MQQPVTHLTRRIALAHKAALEALNDIERQVEQQAKQLDEMSQARRFDEEAAEAQSRLVAALQDAMTLLERAEGALADAQGRLEELERT
ncbi:MAG: hypothetical protein M9894_30845 [Planctomycetes bacterium]|nr:hypothetical protein [Planctomycetota bacterium]